jgi:hypothetical protein
MESNTYILPKALLKNGKWEVNLKFDHKGESYFIQQKIKI